jgi:hypothetical protein
VLRCMLYTKHPTNGEGRHKAIIAYLGVINAPNTAAAFREEANVSEAFDDAMRKKYEGLLEKKWTSVVRLQKKVGKVAENSRYGSLIMHRCLSWNSAIRVSRVNWIRPHRHHFCVKTKTPPPGYHAHLHGIPSSHTAHLSPASHFTLYSPR